MKEQRDSTELTWNVINDYPQASNDPCQLSCIAAFNNDTLSPTYTRSMHCGAANPLRVWAEVDAKTPAAISMSTALNMSAYCNPYNDVTKHTEFKSDDGNVLYLECKTSCHSNPYAPKPPPDPQPPDQKRSPWLWVAAMAVVVVILFFALKHKAPARTLTTPSMPQSSQMMRGQTQAYTHNGRFIERAIPKEGVGQ